MLVLNWSIWSAVNLLAQDDGGATVEDYRTGARGLIFLGVAVVAAIAILIWWLRRG